MNKKISVIVPVYNCEQYLEECIESIINQTYLNMEIILIDDGSTDSSVEIIEKYKAMDTRIISLTQSNQGVSQSRNNGLRHVTGEYILFLDADDWLDKNCCRIAVETIEETKADVVCWSYMREYPDSSKPTILFGDSKQIWNEQNVCNFYKKMIGLTEKELQQPQMVDSLITVWGKLYKKEILDNHFFVDLQKVGSEDTLFNIEVFQNVKKITYIPQCLLHYRKAINTSLTHRYKKELMYQWKELYIHIEQILNKQQADEMYYHALSNRIALGLIGLGLNIAEDDRMSFKEKKKELSFILSQQHYKDALKHLERQYLPLKWKVFFGLASNNSSFLLCVLLYIMNFLRGN